MLIEKIFGDSGAGGKEVVCCWRKWFGKNEWKMGFWCMGGLCAVPYT